VAIIRHGSSPREECYWSLRTTIERNAGGRTRIDENEAVDALDGLLRDAVSLRMIADVPLGVFLSGGYDSSTVVAMMQANASVPLRTFTASFEQGQFDEAPHAEAVARHLGTQHTTFRVEGREACDVVPKLSQMYDEPFADSSQIPTYLISLLTRQNVTVALSGDGGDELFTGYNRYHWAEKIWAPFARMPQPIRRVCGATLRSIPQSAYDCLSLLLPAAHRPQQGGFNVHRIADLIALPSIDAVYDRLISHTDSPMSFLKGSEDRADGQSAQYEFLSGLTDPVDRMRYADLMSYLPDDVLTKVDRASMAVGLEVRAPILDHRIVEWVWHLPPHLNTRARRPKHLLRCVLERYVPAALVDRPKRGFAVPLSRWLRGPLRDWAEDLLSTRSLADGSLLDPPPVRRLWADFLAGSDRHQYLLWNILMLVDWARVWRAPSAGAAPFR
jgi:asparagine synthase (glutamine-hydrolysing)